MTARVREALLLVRRLGERPDPLAPLAVGDLARDLGLGLSAASRLCRDLEELGMLTRSAHGSYALGPRALRLSGRAAGGVARRVRLALLAAAQQTGETVCLAAGPEGSRRVIAAVEPVWTLFAPADLGAEVPVGTALDLGAGESTTGSAVEVAAPVLDPAGEQVAVVGIRLAAHRARRVLPRARRAVADARAALEDALAREAAPPPPEPVGEGSLAAAVALLERLAEADDTAAGLARGLGLRVDRVQRLLAAGRAAGVVRPHGIPALDWSLHGWHRAATRRLLVDRGRALVAETASRRRVNAFITVLTGLRSLTLVEELAGTEEGLRMAPWLGRPCPLLDSDGGPTLLSDHTPAEVARLLPARLSRGEADLFARRAGEAARDGVLVMQSIEARGYTSASAPIRDATGTVVAAACLVGPTAEVLARRRELEGEARELAARISEALAA